MNCPMCNGLMERKKADYVFGEYRFGVFDADVCKKCGEKFFTEEASDKIDEKAKQLGVWGLGKETKLTYSGNSLIIRIPKKIVDYMNLRKGEAASIFPEGKKKLTIEIRG